MLVGTMRALIGAVLAVAVTIAAPAQAAKFYIESKLGEVSAEQRAKVEKPRPVQLIFQFTTDQKANPKATKYVKEQVFKLVRESGAFSEVVETPVEGGAMLAITMDNIVQKDAAGKGFVTGLTFGLAKTVVRDGYLIVAEYNAAAGATPIRREVTHGLWLTMGTKEVPGPELIQVKNATIGIETIVRQGIGHAVNQLAAFAGAAPAEPAPAQPGA
jgi:hypothetical protein